MHINNIRNLGAVAAFFSMLAFSAANPVSAVDTTPSDAGNSESNVLNKRGDCYALLEYAINSQVANQRSEEPHLLLWV